MVAEVRPHPRQPLGISIRGDDRIVGVGSGDVGGAPTGGGLGEPEKEELDLEGFGLRIWGQTANAS